MQSNIAHVIAVVFALIYNLGNLALSRALGDFVYKRDGNRAQDEQIVIGNVCITWASCDAIFVLPVAKPEVMIKQLTPNHEFIVLACDGKYSVWGCGCVVHVITGIWDVMTNEEVIEFVRSAIAEGTQPDTVSNVCSI